MDEESARERLKNLGKAVAGGVPLNVEAGAKGRELTENMKAAQEAHREGAHPNKVVAVSHGMDVDIPKGSGLPETFYELRLHERKRREEKAEVTSLRLTVGQVRTLHVLLESGLHGRRMIDVVERLMNRAVQDMSD